MKTRSSVTFLLSDEIKQLTTDETESQSDDDIDFNSSHGDDLSKSSGDMVLHSFSSFSDLEDTGDQRHLKRKLTRLETRCRLLELEREKITAEYTLEHKKNAKLQKKLTFVKDNQEVFMKLKEAYINMKYNEAAGRKMIEIREKGIQTWDGILCAGCIEAEEIRRDTEEFRKKYENSYLIPTETFRDLGTTFKYLKELIERREKSWSLNIEKELKFRAHLEFLKKENKDLKELLKFRKEEGGKNNEPENEPSRKKEISILRTIVVKYAKRMSDLTEKAAKQKKKLSSPLSENEQKFVDAIMERCKKKSKASTRNASKDRVNGNQETKLNVEKNDELLTKCQRSENAILMMDSIFSSETCLI